MQDRPNAAELAAAIAHFLREEIMPSLQDDRLLFRTRVALNALGMLEREARTGNAALEFEAATLQAHLHCTRPPGDLADAVASLNQQLAAQLRAGTEPPGTLALLQDLIRRKVLIASPRALEKRQASRGLNPDPRA